MSLEANLKRLAARIPETIGKLATEEATKNALVMPFIAALGYDVFNPVEVVPEFTADVAMKKGEKVDYAIMRDDAVIVLIEAKKASEKLTNHAGQLYRYFSVTQARIALLTNGVEYRFFSDIDEPNKMDAKPFLIIDLSDLRDAHIAELGKLTKDGFDLQNMLEAAGDLKYMREIRKAFEEQWDEPEEEFVKFFFAKATSGGRFSKTAKEQFSRLVRKTFHQFVSDRVADRLRSALRVEDAEIATGTAVPVASPGSAPEPASEGLGEVEQDARPEGIETTQEELEGYNIVRAIVCSVIPVQRVTYRDTKSYFGILIDDNNRKPLCRLRFNGKTKKYLGLFDGEKNEERHALTLGPSGIYAFSDQLRTAAKKYMEDALDTTVVPLVPLVPSA